MPAPLLDRIPRTYECLRDRYHSRTRTRPWSLSPRVCISISAHEIPAEYAAAGGVFHLLIRTSTSPHKWMGLLTYTPEHLIIGSAQLCPCSPHSTDDSQILHLFTNFRFITGVGLQNPSRVHLEPAIYYYPGYLGAAIEWKTGHLIASPLSGRPDFIKDPCIPFLRTEPPFTGSTVWSSVLRTRLTLPPGATPANVQPHPTFAVPTRVPFMPPVGGQAAPGDPERIATAEVAF